MVWCCDNLCGKRVPRNVGRLNMLQGLLGIFSGLITPVQTAVNTRLGRSIGSPLRASLVSFSVGLIAMLT